MVVTRAQTRVAVRVPPPVIHRTAFRFVRFTAQGAAVARQLMIPTDRELKMSITSIHGVRTYHFTTHRGEEFCVPENIAPDVWYVDTLGFPIRDDSGND
tara:strand:+ start:1471 stop:1767 length:297 start_codon:yes stop_codon:yes gene_type:complete